MSTDQNQGTQNIYHSDEIDLFELIESIWKEKSLIIAITAIVTALAVTYALTTTPTYQATNSFYQPSSSGIQNYNLGRKEAELKEFTVEDIYNIYLSNLQSQQLQSEFFNDIYLPSLTEEQRQAKRSTLRNSFNQTLTIKQTNPKENKHRYEVSVIHQNPEQAAHWANLYVNKAVARAKQEIQADINAEVNTNKASINLKIENLLHKAQTEREDEIIRLKEALQIAKSLGLKNPSLPQGKATIEGANYVDRNLTYLRGENALTAQIKALQERKNNHPFIADLRDQTAQLELLNALPTSFKQTQVVRIDKQALIPDTPIKPKKRLIVAIGFVLGGMLGVFAALTRTAIRQRKTL